MVNSMGAVFIQVPLSLRACVNYINDDVIL